MNLKPPVPRLPQFGKRGILQRKEFGAFVRAVAQRVGFQVESTDFTGVHEVGNALHIRRRYRSGITVTLELQARWARAKYCILAEDNGVAYTVNNITAVYANGTITETFTIPDPGPHYETPDTADHTCAAPDYTTDEDPEFEYGSYVSGGDNEYSGAVDAADLLALALAAVENDGAPTTGGSSTWIEGASPPAIADIELGEWTDGGLPLTTRTVDSYQYRWGVTGGSVNLQWDQGGTSFDIDLDSGDFSSWYADSVIGLAMGVNDKIENIAIMEN